ncbi:MAG: hypothetical protein H6Q70_1656 [Firmicutes bacterium]|nr:hypothetical protein [Bacillota bacterium]
MKKLDLVLLRIFLYGLPLIILFAIFSYSYDVEANASSGNYLEMIYDFAGLMFGSWLLLSIYLAVRLIFSGAFREKVLTRLTFIKERDEREVMLTGKAAKATMLTTIAILIFLFCLSCFQISVSTIPPEQVIDGKTRELTLNLNFELLANLPKNESSGIMQKQNILDYTGLPFSGSTVIFGLLIWQIIAYNYWMRRLLKE